MSSRRNFLRLAALGAAAFAGKRLSASPRPPRVLQKTKSKATVISTWTHGVAANEAAWKILGEGGRALDAVEAGVMVTESDETGRSVGLGGMPDREGIVTLDACIMNEEGQCGGVAFLQDIEHPISVARKVMEETPHVLLVGHGAYLFAKEMGFPDRELLVPEAKKSWEEWKENSSYKPIINIENHDTIGQLALDEAGNLSGACTTSGMAFKRHGRVGDSPIIGAGLFVDNEVGAACATGVGEAVIRIAGSHLVVELMRQGYDPEAACKAAVERIMKKEKSLDGMQVGFLALNREGDTGAYAVYEGFNYALRTKRKDKLQNAKFFRSW